MSVYLYILTKDKKIERIRCWDENNKPIVENFMLWGRWLDDIENRKIAFDKVGEIAISTVFLSIDHGFSFEKGHKPVLFETAVFADNDVNIVDRYTSYKDALKGHQKYVDQAADR